YYREMPDSSRIPAGYLLTTFTFDVDEPVAWPTHQHEEHELLWSAGGMAKIEAEGRIWAIPPSLAVWVPARVAHAVSAERGAELRATYFTATDANIAAMRQEVTGVAMIEPLRVLLGHNLQGNLTEDARLRLQRVILDLLVPAPQESFDLQMPRSPHLQMVASAILSDPADKRTSSEWAYECGLHARTLARQFQTETGVTFTQWRILARLQLAVRELTLGRSIVSVSRTVGYRNPTTFIEHFRELTGQTPTEYIRGARGR
ncbi:helix-turn-helix domain-containing protein, partial [Glutamicibacter ardleyensis]|uniref:helix-turn-helix domain-containing protein n=1 Tax=Glutamicibacter ardleyensis TaxID=225894 RepID=UPI003FD35E4F